MTDALTPDAQKVRAIAAGDARTARERGHAVRKQVPRSPHGHWALRTAADRDPVEILQAQAADRVPSLVPIRYARMLASAFTFYRGAAAIMADDLATMSRVRTATAPVYCVDPVAAVAESAPTTSWRDGAISANTTAGIRAQYRPVYTGRPTMFAYPSGSGMAMATITLMDP